MKKPFYIGASSSNDCLITIHYSYISGFSLEEIKLLDDKNVLDKEPCKQKKMLTFQLIKVEFNSEIKELNQDKIDHLNKIILEIKEEVESTEQTLQEAYEDHFGF